MPNETSIDPYSSSARSDGDRVAEVRILLRTNRCAAIELIRSSSVVEKQRLFLELVALASFEHSDLELIRIEIQDLPRDWVLANIETAAEFQLMLPREDGADEFRLLHELFFTLDVELADRLATRARNHPNPTISEQFS